MARTGARVAAFEGPLRSVVVVGAGLAGLRACESLRRGGFDGTLTLIGEETRAPYDRPPLSKQFLAGSWSSDRVVLREPDELDALRLDLRLGTRAEALDLARRRLRVTGGEEIPFDGLVLATGATPRRLPSAPAGLDGLHVLRTFDDCLALRHALGHTGAQIVVIGAGFIGSEVASTAAGLGASVTVVEAAPVPLVRALGEEMGRACASLHDGVRLLLGTGVDEVLADGKDRRVTGVRLADGTRLDADAVLVAIGVAPATGWLEGSGLEISDGVVCDETLHAAPGVVVAGDIARWPDAREQAELRVEHWENAAAQGDHAAASLLAGAGATPFDAVPYFWSDQFGVKIQFVGHAREGDEVRVVEGSVDERRFVACYGREGRLVAALSFARPRLLVQYRELLNRGSSFEDALALDPS
jgi:NADPH-dependent 2,4-dienoyl-CoA reductase/sulfur reductase-like enzyme